MRGMFDAAWKQDANVRMKVHEHGRWTTGTGLNGTSCGSSSWYSRESISWKFLHRTELHSLVLGETRTKQKE